MAIFLGWGGEAERPGDMRGVFAHGHRKEGAAEPKRT
jgi:hypothetical protein